jgi:hypothetical protein
MLVQFLWFDDCPNHQATRALLQDVLSTAGLDLNIEDIDASDPEAADALRFPGSPTIRIDGRDIEPGFVDPQDYAPRCRVYSTSNGLRGVPERAWIEVAIDAAIAQESPP